MAYLGNAPARSFISFERQVFTIVNSQTAYTLDHSVNNENDIRLVVNNVVQEPGSGKAYTASGTTLTLSAALVNGTDEMYCVFLGRAVATNKPGAGSVGASQLASDAVTAAKLNDDIISGQTALGATPADTDEFLVSDAGTIKRVDYSYIKAGTNTPAFEAYTTGLQSITDATYTKMTMASEVYDTDSDYDNSTNYRFTPSVAGKYFVYAKGFADPSNYGNLKSCQMRIYKNGAALSYTHYDIMPGDNDSADGGTGATPSVRGVVDMNGSSDYLEVYFKLNTWNGSGAQVGSKQFGAYRILT